MFVDRQHLVYYDDESLESLVSHYLSDTAEREAIAEAGREEVLRWHTYDHRVTTLLETVFDLSDEDEHDPTRTTVVTDPLLDEGLQLTRERQFDAALDRFLRIGGQRDLDVAELALWHSAVAECLNHAEAADDVAARRRAALTVFDPSQASRILPLLAA